MQLGKQAQDIYFKLLSSLAETFLDNKYAFKSLSLYHKCLIFYKRQYNAFNFNVIYVSNQIQ
jgi:hypothetical protein